MFARKLNELQLTIEIRPVDLLLVKEGRHMEGDDKERRVYNRGSHVVRNPSRPRLRDSRDYGDYDTAEGCFNMAFVSSRTARNEERFYLPGSSLRGVLRSAAERVVARWKPNLLSDPFLTEQDLEHPLRSSELRLRKQWQDAPPSESVGPLVYRHTLPIERCFGHTALRGRWVVADAWMRTGQGEQRVDEPQQFQQRRARIEVRDGVGIDRHTGAAHNKIKYQFEALSGGAFTTTLTITNYERWQLGLLAHTLAALDGGQARIGYGTRHGLGRVKLAVKTMRWRWYGGAPRRADGLTYLPTLRELAKDAELKGDYGWQEPANAFVGLPMEASEIFLGYEATLTPQAASDPHKTDWAASPWPTLGPLLAPALQAWQRVEEAV